jgi:hypothetical protein
MLFGRALRKEVSRTLAYGAYRWIAIWVLVALCASYGTVGLVMSFGIIAVSICVGSAYKGVSWLIATQSREDWAHLLTNRYFYQLFWENLKSDNREYLDIMELFKQAADKAVDDIKIASAPAQWGFLDKTWWHWLGGVLHFLTLLIGDVIYFGSAIWVGTRWNY